MSMEEKHYANEELLDWIKRNAPEYSSDVVSSLGYWLLAREKKKMPPTVSWEVFKSTVANLGERYSKWEKTELYQLDGQPRRLKKLLEWTIQFDEVLSDVSKTSDIRLLFVSLKQDYKIIEAFSLDTLIVAL